jgi:hypothetical protein
MNREISEVNPIDYFRSTKLDESFLLEMSLSKDIICIIVDYAGESFDWKKNTTHQPQAMPSNLPCRVFKRITFEKISNIELEEVHGEFVTNISDFSISRKPGRTVIYSINCRKSVSGFCFEVMSNKFEYLSFEFQTLNSSEIIARPNLIGGNWVYFSVPQGVKVNILDPFALKTDV